MFHKLISPLEIGIYGFVFYRDGEWIYSIIDDKLYLKSPCWDSPSMQRDLLQQIDREDVENVYRKTYQTGSKALFFAQCKAQNETWVPLLEKAYAKAHGDFAALSGGWIGEGLEDLSGGVTTELFTSDILDIDEFWDNEMSKVNQEFMFGASTGLLEHGYGERDGISEGHAYVIMEARTLNSGQRLVKMRNPWGKVRKGLWEGAWSDGSKEWTKEAQEELDHKFGSDSVFWISYEDMIRKYSHFDRTRLFRDPEWRCCQRWIGVDVPWKPSFHEKFQIKLTQDSPLILVLSQLDNRYFKGLRGQYTFRLHFRLHYQDSPNAEDYIVRSHGNYLMNRSVSVELPDMPAGNYVVYLKVTGERDSSQKSVEDVVKRECSQRVENEKLAQVGYAYDLAHSKAWDHLDKVVKLRNKSEQEKATKSRQRERRKLWEKRHTNREIAKTQGEKNKEKKQRKRREWDEKWDKIEAEELEKEKAEKEAAEVAAKKDAEETALGEKETPAVKEPAEDAEKTIAAEDADDESDDDPKDDEEKPAEDATEDSNASVSTSSPQYTPQTIDSVCTPTIETKQEVPPIDGAPPSPATPTVEEPKPRRPRPAYDSAGESSDSPIEDWEELYSSDDMVRKPRLVPQGQPAPKDDYDTEEEKLPDPWNAICIVGIRVYSKDGGLELRTVMEGGEFLEGGMGEKGAADLDNAQANAGGCRANDNKEPPNGSKEGSEFPFPCYAPVIRKDGKEIEDKDKPSERNSAIRKYIRMDSADTTRFNTPIGTPSLESDKRLGFPFRPLS